MFEELFTAVEQKLEWPKNRALSTREYWILLHYEHEVWQGHMDFNTAVQRAAGDILGQNRHPSRPQRH